MTHFLIRPIIYYGATKLARTDDSAQKWREMPQKWRTRGIAPTLARIGRKLDGALADETGIKTTSFVSTERGG